MAAQGQQTNLRNGKGMNVHAPASCEALRDLVTRLCDSELFPHPVHAFEIIETHISYVLLTGDYAYKFKKPVNLGFLDFSDPGRRHFYCQEELRLNQALSPDLYLEVVGITGTMDKPVLQGRGPVLEYAVKMRQFRESDRLDKLAHSGKLSNEHIDDLASLVARFHQAAPTAPIDSSFGEPAEIRKPVLENFRQITPLLTSTDDLATLADIRKWTEQRLIQLQGDFHQRRVEGSVRECHGDLHLGNIALFENKVMLFDRLEFSEPLRWIDTMNDVAFLLMDLDCRGHRNLSMRFMNQYLEYSGDYLGLGVLRFYMVYRAMVRAKVALIQARQLAEHGQDHHVADEEFSRYIAAAKHYSTLPDTTPLIITYGLSGAGKTWVARQLAESLEALLIRSDVERKRMFDIDPHDKVPGPVGQGLYKPDVTQETYRRLHASAYMILDAGCSAILDATFMARENRELMEKLARSMGVPYVILDIQAADSTLRERIATRSDSPDASDATLEVLDYQLAHRVPLTPEELAHTITIDNEQDVDITALTESVRELIDRQK